MINKKYRVSRATIYNTLEILVAGNLIVDFILTKIWLNMSMRQKKESIAALFVLNAMR
jgi:Fe2+ or Zn2+ uptake regulation protein